jgi:hypothetical protein
MLCNFGIVRHSCIKFTKCPAVSLSSCEAELRGIVKLTLSVIHYREMLDVFDCKQGAATKIYCDNKTAIDICNVLRMTNQTRHIQWKIDFIRYQINSRIVSLVFIHGTDNPADVLTKALDHQKFIWHTDTLLNGLNIESSHFTIDHEFQIIDQI